MMMRICFLTEKLHKKFYLYIKSVQNDVFLIWVGAFMIWCRPKIEVKKSIFEPFGTCDVIGMLFFQFSIGITYNKNNLTKVPEQLHVP